MRQHKLSKLADKIKSTFCFHNKGFEPDLSVKVCLPGFTPWCVKVFIIISTPFKCLLFMNILSHGISMKLFVLLRTGMTDIWCNVISTNNLSVGLLLSKLWDCMSLCDISVYNLMAFWMFTINIWPFSLVKSQWN